MGFWVYFWSSATAIEVLVLWSPVIVGRSWHQNTSISAITTLNSNTVLTLRVCLELINTLLQIYPSHVNTTHNTSVNLPPPPPSSLPHKNKNNYEHSCVLALDLRKSVLQKSREKKKKRMEKHPTLWCQKMVIGIRENQIKSDHRYLSKIIIKKLPLLVIVNSKKFNQYQFINLHSSALTIG